MPNAVLVKFTKRGSALTVKDLQASATVDKEYQSKHAGKFLKKLMDDSQKFKAVQSKMNEAYLWHRNITLPFLDNGMRMLNVEKLEDYMQAVSKYKSEIQRLLLDLKPEWDQEIAKDMQRLGGLANPKDYPTWQEIEYKYEIDVKVLPVPEASDFRFEVDQEIVNELDNLKKQAKIDGRKEVFGRVEKFVSNAIENCSKEKPRIHETMLGNMADLADIMKYLNVHSDPEMDIVSEKLAELSKLVTTFNLRNDPVIRSNFALECERFLKKLESGNWNSDEEGKVVVENDAVFSYEAPRELVVGGEVASNELANSVI